MLTAADWRAANGSVAVPHVSHERMTRMRHRRMLRMLNRRWRQMRRSEILMMMMRWYPGILGIGCSGIVTGGQWVLTGMMRKLLHRRGCTVMMQRCEEAQSTLGGGRTCRRIKLVFPSQKKVTRRVTRMMAHVMPHVRRTHVGGRVRMMRWITLVMEVVRRRLDPRLNTGNDIRWSTGRSSTPGWQLDTQIRDMMQLGNWRHAVHIIHYAFNVDEFLEISTKRRQRGTCRVVLDAL